MPEAPLGLSKDSVDPDPFKQFQKWFKEAQDAEPILPESMALATATPDGKPSARMVLLKGFDARGFVFYTNYESRKARELAENASAALVLYWRHLERQICITGTVSRIPHEESEAYFRTRPRGSQIAAHISKQSQVVENRRVLEAQFRELTTQYNGREVPLPANWGGYRLYPDAIEFWQGRSNRLHDRLRYRRQSEDSWLIERLAP